MLLLLLLLSGIEKEEEEEKEELEGKRGSVVGSTTDTFYIIIADVVSIIVNSVQITSVFNGVGHFSG